jgi:hypothetical protein
MQVEQQTTVEEPSLRAVRSTVLLGAHPECKGTNCGCTDGVSHSDECRQEHGDAANGVLGKCSVPMWMGGCPAGSCGEKAYGERPHSKMRMNYSAGRMMREDGRYDGYVPGLACPKHGGPEAPNVKIKGNGGAAVVVPID